MSKETQELIHVCERLPEAERAEVADFARFLLAKTEAAMANGAAAQIAERWLAEARGVSTVGLTTDQVMALTRGEA